MTLGFLLAIDPLLTGICFSIVVALLIEWIRKKGRIEQDMAIGILFSNSMALGVVFIAISKRYNADISGFLFGNISDRPIFRDHLLCPDNQKDPSGI